MNRSILILCSVIILLTSCKKYPGGGFTKRGPKNITGIWKLSLYEVNGVDSTDLINYNGDDRYKTIKIYEENTKYNPHLYITPFGGSESVLKFKNNNTKLNIYINGPYSGGKGCGGNPVTCFREIFCPEKDDNEWEIIKLNKKEIILISSQINSYRIKLNS